MYWTWYGHISCVCSICQTFRVEVSTAGLNNRANSESEISYCTWSDNKVREIIAVKVLHTSLLNIIMVAFKVLLLGSYALMPTPSPPFKTILELVLWNGLQSCHCITPDVINVIKMPSFHYFLYL